MNTHLENRTGLPDDLAYLLAQYPRSDWQAHRNLGDMAQFWLKRHDMFRDLGGKLSAAITDYREQQSQANEFTQLFVPRLRFFLEQLNGHHHIEDTHYFPVFAAAEKRLVPGFELLDADHTIIHGALQANAEAANALLEKLSGSRSEARFAADHYASNVDNLIKLLTRHLHDEEDLIIPLILDRSEAALGI